ncbi:hypothetical protein VB151_15830 [Xanthomonas fragariae]|uniref:Uncharacterized protein n=1 Tax=Xanthomonas fragariae TaxID=48664 RepID=A0A1Y6H102_9XANT|nr:hypothetical protein [Xanthomonas fragariae]AOD16299.1 hypothetical protein BER92_18505 [Xanthomonas fragariae]AOD19728.1 hypothetical protein BER93_18555 [Xanthomonas fragariae]MBL9197027.1 hypothetical protein [Xanthomonas fragariae]MBL9221978.1 hypothetical protein [Xanthomonas fragariae]MDM7555866.1 hypothetical protein [Xanthomonas fragariae]
MKLDPSILFLMSLLAMVLCTATAVAALMFGQMHVLATSWSFYTVMGTALITLAASFHALGKPPSVEERVGLRNA